MSRCGCRSSCFVKFVTISQLKQESVLLLLNVPRDPRTLTKVDTIDIKSSFELLFTMISHYGELSVAFHVGRLH